MLIFLNSSPKKCEVNSMRTGFCEAACWKTFHISRVIETGKGFLKASCSDLIEKSCGNYLKE